MDGKIRIGLVVFATIMISFGLIYAYLQSYYELSIAERHYDVLLSQIDPEKKKIVIVGASSVAMLNVTHIDKRLAESGWDSYEAYKLTRDGDRPTKRIYDLEELIYLNPDIVFYGLGTREFGYNLFSPGSTTCTPVNQNQLSELEKKISNPDEPQNIFQLIFEEGYLESFAKIKNQISGMVWSNDLNYLEDPKLVTVNFLDRIFSDNKTSGNADDLNQTERIDLKLQEGVSTISTNVSLEKQTRGMVLGYCSQVQNEEFEILSKIIRDLEDKDIQVVLFAAPYSGPFLEKFSEVGIRHYFLNLQNLANQNEIQAYTFLDRYTEQEIFHDLTHVSKSKEGNIFSEEFSEFVIAVIEDHENIHRKTPVNLSKFEYDSTSGEDLEFMDFHGKDLSVFNFKNSNLAKTDFSNLDLTNKDMRFANLEGANLSHTIMNGANLEGANMGFANLDGADLSGASFSGVNFGFASMENVTITNSDFSYSVIDNGKFNNMKLHDNSFAGASLFNSDFSNTKFVSVDFSEADLSLSDFSNATFDDVIFSGAVLINSDFSGTDLAGFDFSKTQLDGANFENSNMSGAFFDFAQITSVDLSGMDLSRSRFLATNLAGSSLENANLAHSNSKFADFGNANLENANLSFSDFSSANFFNANLSGANLTNTNLKFANFTGTILADADLGCFDHSICK